MRGSTVIITVGLAIVAIGLVLRYAPWLVAWFGRLPGDIRVERPGSRVFIPITSMLIVSIVATLLVNLFLRGR